MMNRILMFLMAVAVPPLMLQPATLSAQVVFFTQLAAK